MVLCIHDFVLLHLKVKTSCKQHETQSEVTKAPESPHVCTHAWLSTRVNLPTRMSYSLPPRMEVLTPTISLLSHISGLPSYEQAHAGEGVPLSHLPTNNKEQCSKGKGPIRNKDPNNERRYINRGSTRFWIITGMCHKLGLTQSSLCILSTLLWTSTVYSKHHVGPTLWGRVIYYYELCVLNKLSLLHNHVTCVNYLLCGLTFKLLLFTRECRKEGEPKCEWTSLVNPGKTQKTPQDLVGSCTLH